MTFVPIIRLSPETTYKVTIRAGLRDVLGNALASDYTWFFTTASF